MELEYVLTLITANIEFVLLGTIALLFLCLVVFISINIRFKKLSKRYHGLMQGMEGNNLEEIMLSNRQMINTSNLKINNLEQGLKEVECILTGCVRKVGTVRYNAFPEMGSDLSFSVALIDEGGNGVVLTGLTGRQDSRTYAKPIVAGKSSYLLTDEELQALQRALS
ncbi:MAG: DUF4446 family protein [Clostridia bacterium]|nr:DUF4446 family protein [Clostridia bacterium]